MALESIALIPSGYKATKVYSQLPVNGNGDFTFDRGTSTAQTRVNKDGLIESVAQDVPRLDYLDGGCPSLLLEPATTNLLTYSEDFSNASWLKNNLEPIVTNSTISPKGDLTADALIENTTTSSHNVYQSINVTSGSIYTISFFVKANGRNRIRIADNFGRLPLNVIFDISNENVVFGSGTITNYGNGWYRCSATTTATETNFEYVYVILVESGTNTNYLGDGTSGVYLWGAQLEQKSYATSYVPSLAGVSGVRAAETCNGAGTTDEINSQEGVLYAEIRALADDLTERYWSLTDGSNQDYILIGYSNNSNEVIGQIRDNGSIQRNFTTTLPNTTDFAKLCVKWNGTNFYFYVNGLLIDSGSYSSITGLSNLKQGRDGGSLPFYGKTKELRVYKEALSDLELARLTGFTSFAEMRDYLNYTAE